MSLQYLHTMVRVKDLEVSIAFYQLLGLKQTRRIEREGERYTLVFMSPEGHEDRPIELTIIGMAMRNCQAIAVTLGI